VTTELLLLLVFAVGFFFGGIGVLLVQWLVDLVLAAARPREADP